MWSLGKVINTPEVMRVYIGSFWDKPYKNKDNEKLFKYAHQQMTFPSSFAEQNNKISSTT